MIISICPSHSPSQASRLLVLKMQMQISRSERVTGFLKAPASLSVDSGLFQRRRRGSVPCETHPRAGQAPGRFPSQICYLELLKALVFSYVISKALFWSRLGGSSRLSIRLRLRSRCHGLWVRAPPSGSVLTARSLEPASDSVSPSLSLSLPLLRSRPVSLSQK